MAPMYEGKAAFVGSFCFSACLEIQLYHQDIFFKGGAAKKK